MKERERDVGRRQEGAMWRVEIRSESGKKVGNCRIECKKVIKVGRRGPSGSKFTTVVCFHSTEGMHGDLGKAQ